MTFSLTRTRAMARKEALHIVRDVRSLGMALAVPVVLLLLFGLALSLDVDRIRTVIHDADRTSASHDLAEKFRASRFFEVTGYVDAQKDIQRMIDRNQVIIGISIPRGFGHDTAAGRKVDVQVLLDGSDSNTASIALGYTETLIRNYSYELRRQAQSRKGGASTDLGLLRPPIDARLRVWYNAELQSKNYVVPGLIAVILMIIGALLTSLTIAKEWEMGTMEQLLSTPVRPAELVLGKMLAYFAIGIFDTAVALTIGRFIFEVPFRGSYIFLGFTSCIFLFGALCWGLFLSAVARNQLLAFQMGMVSSFLPAFLLSGFVYAIEGMPMVMQILTLVNPTRHFVTILKGVFLKGVGLEALWMEVLFLSLFAVVIFVATTRKMSAKMA